MDGLEARVKKQSGGKTVTAKSGTTETKTEAPTSAAEATPPVPAEPHESGLSHSELRMSSAFGVLDVDAEMDEVSTASQLAAPPSSAVVTSTANVSSTSISTSSTSSGNSTSSSTSASASAYASAAASRPATAKTKAKAAVETKQAVEEDDDDFDSMLAGTRMHLHMRDGHVASHVAVVSSHTIMPVMLLCDAIRISCR